MPKQQPLRLEFYIATSYCFVQNFSNGILIISLWPYLRVLDPLMTESFFGFVVGAASISGLLSSIVCGIIATKYRDIRIPLSTGVVLMILGNLVYFNLHLFSGNIRYYAMFSRLLSGMSAGNSCLINTFVALTASRSQLSRAIALTSCGTTMGILLGPAFQNVFTALGYPGITILSMNINQYNAPALAAVFMNVFGLFVVSFLKPPHAHGEFIEDEENEKPTKKDQINEMFRVFGWRGIPLCLATRFVQMSVLSMMDTIGSSYTMFLFDWNNSEALLYGSRHSLIVGIVALSFQVVYTLFPQIRWKKYGWACAFSLFSFAAYFFISFPWSFIGDGQKDTSDCLNSTHSWCLSSSPVSLIRFYLPYYFFVTIAINVLSISNSFCLTQFAGRTYQGIAQGLQQVSSYSGSFTASLVIANSYMAFGPSAVWMIEWGTTVFLATIWIVCLVGCSKRKKISGIMNKFFRGRVSPTALKRYDSSCDLSF